MAVEKVRNNNPSSSAHESCHKQDAGKAKEDPERASKFNALLGRGTQPADTRRPQGEGQGPVGRHSGQKEGQEGFTLGGKPGLPLPEGRGARHGLPVGHEGDRGFGRGGGGDDQLGRLAMMESGAAKKGEGLDRLPPSHIDERGGRFVDLLAGKGQGELPTKPETPPQVGPREPKPNDEGLRQGALAAGATRGREEPAVKPSLLKAGEGDRGKVEGQPAGQASAKSGPEPSAVSAQGARPRGGDLDLEDLRRRPMPRGFDREGLEVGNDKVSAAALERALQAADLRRLEGPSRVEKPSRDLPGPPVGVDQVHRLLMGQGPNGAEARLVIDAGPFAGTEIHFKHGPGGVQAVIQAQNVSTQQTLSGALDEVAKRLRDKGHNLDVKFQNGPRRPPEEQQQQQQPHHGRG